MCGVAAQKTTGALLYIFGLLIAGAMMMATGSQFDAFDQTVGNPDTSNLQLFFWIYTVALFFAAIGMILEFGETFCGAEEEKGVEYFGGLLTLVSIFSLFGFGLGIAIYYDQTKFDTTTPSSISEISSLAWLSGIAGVLLIIGSLLVLKDLLCCTGDFRCDLLAAVQIINMFLAVLLTIFWFLWAGEQDESGYGAYRPGDANDQVRTYSYLIGVVYLLFALIGILKILGVFF